MKEQIQLTQTFTPHLNKDANSKRNIEVDKNFKSREVSPFTHTLKTSPSQPIRASLGSQTLNRSLKTLDKSSKIDFRQSLQSDMNNAL